MLEEELKEKQKEVAFLTDQFEQLKQQGKDGVNIAISVFISYRYRLWTTQYIILMKVFISHTLPCYCRGSGSKQERAAAPGRASTCVWNQGPAYLKSERRAVGNTREIDSPQRRQ